MDTSTYAFHTKQPKWIYLQITGYILTDAFHTKPTKKSTQKTPLASFHTHPKHKIHALLLIAVFSVVFYMMYTSVFPYNNGHCLWFVCSVNSNWCLTLMNFINQLVLQKMFWCEDCSWYVKWLHQYTKMLFFDSLDEGMQFRSPRLFPFPLDKPWECLKFYITAIVRLTDRLRMFQLQKHSSFNDMINIQA